MSKLSREKSRRHKKSNSAPKRREAALDVLCQKALAGQLEHPWPDAVYHRSLVEDWIGEHHGYNV